MIIQNFTDLSHVEERAIIINVGTKLVSTLSILSTLKYIEMPLLVIDCPLSTSGNGDFDYLKSLSKKYYFDLISLALTDHGSMLDNIFNNLNSDYIFLVDSDLEVLNNKIIPLMKHYIRGENVFGTGFTHGPLKFEESAWEFKSEGFYEERMWIPFVMLNRNKIIEALRNGYSFRLNIYYNFLPSYPKISRYLSRKLPTLYKSNLFNFLRNDYHGEKPLYTMYDTGSMIFQYLRYNRNYHFIGPCVDSGIENDYVMHYNGMTRKQLHPDDSHNSVSEKSMETEIIEKLKNNFNFIFD